MQTPPTAPLVTLPQRLPKTRGLFALAVVLVGFVGGAVVLVTDLSPPAPLGDAPLPKIAFDPRDSESVVAWYGYWLSLLETQAYGYGDRVGHEAALAFDSDSDPHALAAGCFTDEVRDYLLARQGDRSFRDRAFERFPRFEVIHSPPEDRDTQRVYVWHTTHGGEPGDSPFAYFLEPDASGRMRVTWDGHRGDLRAHFQLAAYPSRPPSPMQDPRSPLRFEFPSTAWRAAVVADSDHCGAWKAWAVCERLPMLDRHGPALRAVLLAGPAWPDGTETAPSRERFLSVCAEVEQRHPWLRRLQVGGEVRQATIEGRAAWRMDFMLADQDWPFRGRLLYFHAHKRPIAVLAVGPAALFASAHIQAELQRLVASITTVADDS